VPEAEQEKPWQVLFVKNVYDTAEACTAGTSKSANKIITHIFLLVFDIFITSLT